MAVKDYAETFNTNSLILGRNSSNIGGLASNASVETAGIAVTVVYSDSTKGWLVTEDGVQSSAASLPYTADFLVIAGGGSGGIGPGGNPGGGGAGAGGYRAFNSEASGGGGSSESSLEFRTGIVYTITVGGGASARPLDSTNAVEGTDGTNSSISGSNITTITSTGEVVVLVVLLLVEMVVLVEVTVKIQGQPQDKEQQIKDLMVVKLQLIQVMLETQELVAVVQELLVLTFQEVVHPQMVVMVVQELPQQLQVQV